MSVWTDVAYDHARAQRAIDLLERMAGELAARTRARAALADEARQGWSGAGRAGFDHRLGDLVAGGEDLAHRMRLAAVAIDSDLEAAVEEQRRRERRRAELEIEYDQLLVPG